MSSILKRKLFDNFSLLLSWLMWQVLWFLLLTASHQALNCCPDKRQVHTLHLFVFSLKGYPFIMEDVI